MLVSLEYSGMEAKDQQNCSMWDLKQSPPRLSASPHINPAISLRVCRSPRLTSTLILLVFFVLCSFCPPPPAQLRRFPDLSRRRLEEPTGQIHKEFHFYKYIWSEAGRNFLLQEVSEPPRRRPGPIHHGGSLLSGPSTVISGLCINTTPKPARGGPAKDSDGG